MYQYVSDTYLHNLKKVHTLLYRLLQSPHHPQSFDGTSFECDEPGFTQVKIRCFPMFTMGTNPRSQCMAELDSLVSLTQHARKMTSSLTFTTLRISGHHLSGICLVLRACIFLMTLKPDSLNPFLWSQIIKQELRSVKSRN